MNIVRAAVVSENKDIIRFFSLELQMIDVAVDIAVGEKSEEMQR